MPLNNWLILKLAKCSRRKYNNSYENTKINLKHVQGINVSDRGDFK